MAKLAVDFVESTSDTWEHFKFKQEGMRGFTLPGAYLPEFVEALERPEDPEPFYMFFDYSVLNTKAGTTVCKSTKVVPLLQLSAEQRAKLVAHLRTTYAHLISIYR